jgi:hypothetical protein
LLRDCLGCDRFTQNKGGLRPPCLSNLLLHFD